MNKLYSVHDHWTDINKKNDVDIESIDGVITGIKVNGEDYGGGGSSDFSTAKVTIVNNFSSIFEIRMATIRSGEGPETTTGVLSSRMIDTGMTADVILYKGKAEMVLDIYSGGDTPTVVTNGNIENIVGFIYSITGDCTITINSAS